MAEEAGLMEIDGVRLEYVWHGPAPDTAPTIVLLHEGLGCIAGWLDFPARLAQVTGCGVLAYSRQGYGNSSPVPRPHTHMHDEAENTLPAIFDHWDLQKVFLVGHSDGGSIAAIYAGSHCDRRVRGVVLMTPHFFNEEICVNAVADAKKAYESGTLKENLARYHGANVDNAFYGWSDTWLDPEFRDWSIEDCLAHIRVPVLLLWCARDRYASYDQVVVAQETCTCPLELAVLQDAVHWPHREQPAETLRAICGFTDRLMTVHGETLSA